MTRSKATDGSGSTDEGAGTGVNAFASTSSTCLRSAARSRRVHAHPDRERLAAWLVKDRFENPDDEVLRGVVVVVQQDAPEARALQLALLTLLGQCGFL